MSNYQHTAVHKIQYATSCSLPHNPTQNVQLPTYSSTFQFSTPLPVTPSTSHTKCPTTNTQQYISIQYATSCWPPHTPTQNVQLPTHSSTFQFSTSLPADSLTLPHKMSNYQHTAVHFNSVRHFLLTPSHSHTKCPTTNTQQYISIHYTTSCWPPHTPTQKSNSQHTAVHFNSVRHFLLTPSHSHTKCPTTNIQQYISIHYTTSCWPPHTPTQNVQLPIYSSKFNLSMTHCNMLIKLFNSVTNYWYWIVAEWHSRCKFRLVFEMVYRRPNTKSMTIASFKVTTTDGTAVSSAELDLEQLTLWERKVVGNMGIVCDWNKCHLKISQTHNIKIHVTHIYNISVRLVLTILIFGKSTLSFSINIKTKPVW